MPSAGTPGPAERSPDGAARRRRLLSLVMLVAVTALLGWLAFTGGDVDVAGDVLQPGTAAGPEGFGSRADPSSPAEVESLAVPTAIEVEGPGEAATPQIPTGGGSLLVRTLWDDGRPAPNTHFILFADAHRGRMRVPAPHLTDEHGEFRLEGVAAGTAIVYLVVGNDSDHGDVVEGRWTELELVTPRGAAIEGRVADERDAPVSDAELWYSQQGMGGPAQRVGRSDEAGRFRLAYSHERGLLSARKAGYQPSFLARLEEAEQGPITLVLRDGGAALTGRVLDAEGIGVPRADVRVGGEHGWPLKEGLWDLGPRPVWSRTDSAGAFVMEGLPAGWTTLTAFAEGFASAELTPLELPAGSTVDQDIELSQGGVVAGRVIDTLGRPVSQASISTVAGEWTRRESTHSDDQGRYRLTNLSPNEQVLRASHRDFLDVEQRLMVTPDAPVVWDPVLDPGGAISGIVRDRATGRPAVEWGVGVASSIEPVQLQRSTSTDEQGRFHLSGLGKPPWDVVAFQRLGNFAPECLVYGVEPDDVPLELMVDLDVAPDSGVQGRLVRPDHEPFGTDFIELRALDTKGWSRNEVISESGEFAFEGLRPGRYRLLPQVRGFAAPTLAEVVLQPAQVLDLGEVLLQGGGTVLVHVEAADMALLDVMHLSLRSDDLHFGGRFERIGLSADYRSEPTAPGLWRVSVGGEEIARASWPVQVRSGEVSEVRVRVEAGLPLTILLHWSDGERRRNGYRVRVVGGDGELHSDHDPSHMVTELYASIAWLAPGSYRVEVTRPDLPTVVRDIDLLTPHGVQLDLDMQAPEG